MRNRIDFICSECPLLICSESSLWCAFRWLTGPNAVQQRLMLKTRLISKSKRRKLSAAIRLQKKRESDAAYREDHREEKREYDRQRYKSRNGQR
jgi:hypothetical protein